MQRPQSKDWQQELELPMLSLAVAVVAIPALVFSRALLPALPGSQAGLEGLFDRLYFVGSLLSQALALGLAWLLVKLVVASVGGFATSLGSHVASRLIGIPLGTSVGFLLIASSVGPLDPEMHLLLSGLGTTALIASVAPSLSRPSARAAGLLLILCALGSVGYFAARLLALKASLEALPRTYAVARLLGTGGLFFDALSVVWIGCWLTLAKRAPAFGSPPSRATATASLGSGRAAAAPSLSRLSALGVAISVALALAASWAAIQGEASTASFPTVIVSRAFSALARRPSPLGPSVLGPSLDTVAILFAMLLLMQRRLGSTTTRVAMALIALGRCAPDIPVHAALMTSGALLLNWDRPEFRRAASAGTESVDGSEATDG